MEEDKSSSIVVAAIVVVMVIIIIVLVEAVAVVAVPTIIDSENNLENLHWTYALCPSTKLCHKRFAYVTKWATNI